jgi:hypothetical protein
LGLGLSLDAAYATAFFYSGILTREAFAPRPGRLAPAAHLAGGGAIAGAAAGRVEKRWNSA